MKQQPVSPLTNVSSGLLTRSQDEHPELVFEVLVVTAVKEAWVNLLVNAHVALFFGLLLLASNYDIETGLIYAQIHLLANVLAVLIVVFLMRIPADELINKRHSNIFWLTMSDVVIAIVWGVSIMLFFSVSDAQQYNTLVVILLAAGITSAALSAKLIRVMLLGRFLVFAPTLIYLIVNQPDEWLLHTTSLALSFVVCIGIGYAIHVQLLREASTVVELNHSRVEVIQEAVFRESFLKSITHDLGQSLNSMSLFVRSLERKSSECSQEVTALRQCLNASERVLQSVSQLAWVKQTLPVPTVKVLDLNKIIAPLIINVKNQALEKDIELRYVPAQLSVIGDRQYIERAVSNILDNAIHYTKQGKILIGVRNRPVIGMVEIQVWDTGVGVSEQDQKRIFDSYERITDHSNAEGSNHLGLGLSIVKGVADSLNGHVALTSELGKGSCFSLLLQTTVTFKPDCFANTQIVIIDDDQTYAYFLQSTLISMGASVSVITSLDQIIKASEEGFHDCDIAVVDYHLTDTINGYDVLNNYHNYQFGVLISNVDIPLNNVNKLNENISLLRKTVDRNELVQLLLYACETYKS